MPLTDLITIRLSAEKRFLYEKEAAYQGQSLSTYLRERLEKSETSSHNSQGSSSTFSSHDQGILLEILLILRYLVSPEKLNLVRKDLKRLNIPSWQEDNFLKE